MASEFDLIRRHFTKPAARAVLGIGDDCALLKLAADSELAISTDMLVSGVHFFADARADWLGHKALAVNLSDLAAMGATPRWALLALAMPAVDEAWLEQFSSGFFALAREYGVDLVGGDTTRGPLNICITIGGEIPSGRALRRDAAKPGDDIWVTGTLGDAALALAMLRSEADVAPEDAAYLLQRLHRPTPRIEAGLALREHARAAIDVSDGLAADLGHILESSHCGASIHLLQLPQSPHFTRNAEKSGAKLAAQWQLAGGDDYELCFTAPDSSRAQIAATATELGLAMTRVGVIENQPGLRILDADGKPLSFQLGGYDHFR